MAKDTSTMKFGKQAPTFKVNPSVSAPHPQPAHAHHDHIRRDSVFLRPTSSLHLNDLFYTPNRLIKAKAPRTKKFGTQAPTFRVNPSLPTAQATGSFNVIQADQTLDIKTNDALELGPHTWAYYQRLMTGSPHQNPYANLRYAPYPTPATRPTHGQAPSSAPFYSCSSSMPATNPTASQYPRPSSVPTKKTTFDCQATASAPMNPYPPSISSASLNPRPSRIPIMNPYPDSAATSPEFISSEKEDDMHLPPAPPAVQNFPAATPIHSAPFSPQPVNDNTEVKAPPAKVEKKKFLTPRGCRWLRGVPADVYVRTELASDKFVPATLDEEEEKAFDDFLDVDMIED